MDFIAEATSKGFWKMLADFATDTLNTAIELIVDTVVKLSNVDQYFDTNKYMPYIYSIAGALLVICIIKEAIKIQIGTAENKSISHLSIRVVVSGVSIFFLPWSLKNIMIPLNNYLMQLVNSIGVEISVDKMKEIFIRTLFDGGATVATTIIFLVLVWAVALAIFAIAAGIRYGELVLAVIIAPVISTSFIKDGEGIQAWFVDTLCLVFTQLIHLILLQILIQINMNASNKGLIQIIISIGIVVVALRGPKVLSKYLFTSGVGGASIGAVGNTGRMAMMKYYMGKVKP